MLVRRFVDRGGVGVWKEIGFMDMGIEEVGVQRGDREQDRHWDRD